MARKPDAPCASCGKLLWGSGTSLPPGERVCNPCRRSAACSIDGCDAPTRCKGLCHRHYMAKSYATGHSQVCSVDGCGKPFRARGLCFNHYRQVRHAEGATWTKSQSNRERARRHGGVYERFSVVDIFERDGWRCGICGGEVDRFAVAPDPMRVSLDHIVPMSLGGDHSRENVQCSHLRCNARKRHSLNYTLALEAL